MNVRRGGLAFFLAALCAACAPSISTNRAEMPAIQGGRLDLVVTAAETVSAADRGKAKVQLKRSFRDAGYDPVEFGETRQGQQREIEIALTKYEQTTPSKNTTVAAGVGCVYVCPLLAPCLLLPIYYAPQFEISAEVSAYRDGQRLFSDTVTERSLSSANLFETGTEQFREELEELAVHNFTAAIVGRIGAATPSQRAKAP